ncbi:MAG: type 4a pilus biogenesis protein PilO [Granulosicoccaceae bacterium]
MANLNELDVEDLKKIGSAPLPVRIGVIALSCALLVGAYWFFMVKPQLERIESFKRQETSLKQEYDDAAAKAANLDAYKLQLADMRHEFSIMLRQLPDKVDIESLLVDLSQTSVGAGLDVEYFKPQGDIPKEFYAEHPIRLSVKGKYHEFGEFVSGLAALPRIVTLSGIKIGADTEKESDLLVMELTATTYRYLREDQQ